MNIYDDYGIIDNNKVIESVKEIDEKLKKETDKSKRTQLMFEQLLRGLYLNQAETYR